MSTTTSPFLGSVDHTAPLSALNGTSPTRAAFPALGGVNHPARSQAGSSDRAGSQEPSGGGGALAEGSSSQHQYSVNGTGGSRPESPVRPLARHPGILQLDGTFRSANQFSPQPRPSSRLANGDLGPPHMGSHPASVDANHASPQGLGFGSSLKRTSIESNGGSGHARAKTLAGGAGALFGGPFGSKMPARPMSTPLVQSEFPVMDPHRRTSLAEGMRGAVAEVGPHAMAPLWNNPHRASLSGVSGPSAAGSPIRGHDRTPSISSSVGGHGSHAGSTAGNTLRHPPQDPAPGDQPSLLRTTQIGAVASNDGSVAAPFSNRAVLNLQGDLSTMAMGWTPEEWAARRRLVQFWRKQEGNTINATFTPIAPHQFVPNSIVVSCIFREERNECYITSVDTIYLLEALVGVRFTVEEKNRIRRNLEGFKPMTVSKSKADSENFFKLIMGFPNPKPRNIEKDVKVFLWKNLSSALQKILSKYSATYQSGEDTRPILQQSSMDPSANGSIADDTEFGTGGTGPSPASAVDHHSAPDDPAVPLLHPQAVYPTHQTDGASPHTSPVAPHTDTVPTYVQSNNYYENLIHGQQASPFTRDTSPYTTDPAVAPPGRHHHTYSVPYPADLNGMHGGYPVVPPPPTATQAAHARSLSEGTWHIPPHHSRPVAGMSPLGPGAHPEPYGSPSFGYDASPQQPHAHHFYSHHASPVIGALAADAERRGSAPSSFRPAPWQQFDFHPRPEVDRHSEASSLAGSVHQHALKTTAL